MDNAAIVYEETIRDVLYVYRTDNAAVSLEESAARMATHEVLHGFLPSHDNWWVKYYGIMSGSGSPFNPHWRSDANVELHSLAYPAIQSQGRPK